ncbi:hypothetical protein OG478_13560 [Streptomyces phaeochromogenes]|uniref:hypothetical protein n=1 Tax=Streptomyces phaeochromogenes TaxID=1923 RepID=UPI0038638918|nr:hypothetical protein OG478_13560 [Streptomyces phaeochromogenes]
MMTDRPNRRFGPDFVAEQKGRYGHRRPEGRPLSYDLAVEDAYEPWRAWLDAQLALLPEKDADSYAWNLWKDQNFWSDHIELAAGEALRASGLGVEYERVWGIQTPDWTVLDEDGWPVALVEVLTHSPSKEQYGRMRAWRGLVERVKQIPVPVVLTVAGPRDHPLEPPDARTAKKIAQDLRRYLLSPLHRVEFPSQGYTFLLQADRQTGTTMRAPGMRTILIPPSGMAGVVSAQPLVAGIEKKISKYRSLAAETGLPLVVAAGADKFTGLGIEQLDCLLNGEHTVTVQFNYGDTFIHDPLDLQPGNPPRWSMPPELAGVLWMDNEFPFTATWRPNLKARTPAPDRLTEAWRC